MNAKQKTSFLITGFKYRLDAIRQEAVASITNAVAEHKIIGTFYKNMGEHYQHNTDTEQYDSSPIVVSPNSSYGIYGGYEAATVYELFFDEQNRLLCTLNGEAGEDFDELFIRHFGGNMGRHYYEKRVHVYDHDLLRMLAYFGNNLREGQRFCDMVAEQVRKYEQRQKRENR